MRHGRNVVLTDAGLQKDEEKPSIGMAAMDNCGHLLHAFGTPIQFVRKSIIVEALAIREALDKSLQKDWSKVHILSDAKNVSVLAIMLAQAGVSVNCKFYYFKSKIQIEYSEYFFSIILTLQE
ncbi:hypothetical protein HAX54_002485, partial [Datura stramonium]|nr:hypothetical protein [Datura stramonium]